MDALTLVEEEAIRDLSEKAIEAFLTWDGPAGYAITNWPHSSCDFASYIIGGMLLERGFGDWDICWNDELGRSGAHTWLERVENGEVLYVIDATAHQFPDYTDSPYYGKGPTPVKIRFPRERGREPISTLTWGRESYAEALNYVKQKLPQ